MPAVVTEIEATPATGTARRLLRAAVDSRTRQVEEVRRAVDRHAQAVARRVHAESQLEGAREKLAEATGAVASAHAAYRQALTVLAEQLLGWARGCRWVTIPDPERLAEHAAEPATVQRIVAEATTAERERLAGAETALRATRATLTGEIAGHETERDGLERHGDRPPPAPVTRGADRERAAGAPLWRLLDFRPAVPERVRAGVEAALQASGLLDAWVSPDGALAAPDQDTFAEAWLAAPAPGRCLAEVLTVEPGAPVPAERVARLLAGIAYHDPTTDQDPDTDQATATDQDPSTDQDPGTDPRVDPAGPPPNGGPAGPAGESAAVAHPAVIGADGSWRLASARRDHAQARRAQGLAADAERTADQRRQEAEDTATTLRTVEESAGMAEYRQLEAQVTALRARRAEITGERDRLRGEEARLNQLIGRLDEQRHTDESTREAAVATRDAADQRFRELAAGHLPADARVDLDPAALDAKRPTLEAARRLAETLTTVPHAPRNVREAEARLADAVHDAQPLLSGRADLSLEPDEDIRVLTATVDGVRLGVAALLEVLRADRARTADQITADERELFDQTLTGDTRRHLAERIRAANELVDTMNQRLQRVRTASRVRVRLVWQIDPHLPAGTREARDLLLRNPATLGEAERGALHRFFRERVDQARAAETATGWEQQLLQVLDYTAWHQFVVKVDRGNGEGWQPVTKRLHGALSGGEKAIVLHLPLFAAAAAHYQATPVAPRLILLDEVFVGVDSTNRGQLLELLVGFDLDLVLTSDHEWCDYRELTGIAIHQLVTGSHGDDAVTTVRFVWDGHALRPDEEPADPPPPARAPAPAPPRSGSALRSVPLPLPGIGGHPDGDDSAGARGGDVGGAPDGDG